jgi:hypothetical protein
MAKLRALARSLEGGFGTRLIADIRMNPNSKLSYAAAATLAGGGAGFAQAAAAPDSEASSGNVPSIAPTGSTFQAYDQPGFTAYDGALGFSKDAWLHVLITPLGTP